MMVSPWTAEELWIENEWREDHGLEPLPLDVRDPDAGKVRECPRGLAGQDRSCIDCPVWAHCPITRTIFLN
jgi:hypothetical protein